MTRRPTTGQMLRLAHYIVGAATLCFWVWWIADGWGRDLVHRWRTVPARAVEVAPPPPIARATGAPALGRSLPVSVDAPQAAPPVEPVESVATPIVDQRPTRLTIPALALDSAVTEVFLEGDVWQVADYAVGYHHGTGLPGSGNVVLAGHKGLRGAVFGKLESLQVGDDVWIDAAHGRFRYEVSAVGKVWPDQVGIMQPSTEPIVTLITCTNWDTERFVAVATLAETVPAGGSTGTTVTELNNGTRNADG
jgi:sortase A